MRNVFHTPKLSEKLSLSQPRGHLKVIWEIKLLKRQHVTAVGDDGRFFFFWSDSNSHLEATVKGSLVGTKTPLKWICSNSERYQHPDFSVKSMQSCACFQIRFFLPTWLIEKLESDILLMLIICVRCETPQLKSNMMVFFFNF